MKAITLHQPWASLVVFAHKKIETRSWATKHEGWLGIHASAAKPPTDDLPGTVIEAMIEALGISDFGTLRPRGGHHLAAEYDRRRPQTEGRCRVRFKYELCWRTFGIGFAVSWERDTRGWYVVLGPLSVSWAA